MSGLSEVIDRLRYGKTDDEKPAEEEVSTEETTAEAPDTEESENTESTSVEDKAVDQSPEETEDSPPIEEESAPAETEPEAAGEQTEDKEEEASSEGDQTFVIDGETFTLEEVRAMKQGQLRQDDYTRKTQELAAERAKVQSTLTERKELTDAIFAEGEPMGAFVKAHPEVLPRLLDDAKNTREILGNATEVQNLWDDYALVKDNPRLAERFGTEPEAAQDQLRIERENENVRLVADGLDATVDAIATEYPDIDKNAVKEHVLKLGRVPEDGDREAKLDGFGRLYTLFFTNDGEGNLQVDDTLIRAHFDTLSNAVARKAATADDAAAEHNDAVDAKLKDKPKAPASPGGAGPAPVADKLPQAKNLQEVVSRLRGYDD